MHGHDFYVVGQSSGAFDGDLTALNTTNPPRRDVALLPGNGYIALAFQLDNPGTWLGEALSLPSLSRIAHLFLTREIAQYIVTSHGIRARALLWRSSRMRAPSYPQHCPRTSKQLSTTRALLGTLMYRMRSTRRMTLESDRVTRSKQMTAKSFAVCMSRISGEP